MTAQEAKQYMKKQVRQMAHGDWKHRRKDMNEVRMQVVGMIKAFRAAGIITEGWQDILEEVLDMI